VIDTAAIAAWLGRASESLHAARDELTELDRMRGDADHGVNIDNGFAAAFAASQEPHASPNAALLAAGKALAAKAAGTSGPLWGAALERIADDIGTGAEVTWEQFSVGLIGAAEEMSDLGGAREGDNTMIDVIAPSGRLLRDRLAAGDPVAEAVAAAGETARELAAASADHAAKRGRAAYLGERAIGHPDPGCVSASIVIAALSAIATSG
jgi:dihydroxyacetone kinase phosphoprotein-dependent L subunit